MVWGCFPFDYGSYHSGLTPGYKYRHSGCQFGNQRWAPSPNSALASTILQASPKASFGENQLSQVRLDFSAPHLIQAFQRFDHCAFYRCSNWTWGKITWFRVYVILHAPHADSCPLQLRLFILTSRKRNSAVSFYKGAIHLH